MPGDVRDPGIRAPAGRDGMDAFAGLSVEDLEAVPAAAGLVAGAADVSPVEAPAEAADGAAVFAEHCALADQVGGVPERDESVASTRGDVAAIRGEVDAEAG